MDVTFISKARKDGTNKERFDKFQFRPSAPPSKRMVIIQQTSVDASLDFQATNIKEKSIESKVFAITDLLQNIVEYLLIVKIIRIRKVNEFFKNQLSILNLVFSYVWGKT